MNNRCVLSICIPTYNRVDILHNTLNSIYSQNVDQELFEVCISDDSNNDETKDLIEHEFADIENLVYRKIPDCGYLNMIEALKIGRGKLLKLHNDYATFIEGSLQKLINLALDNEYEKNQIYFGSTHKKETKDVQYFDNYNDFMKCVDYMCTFCSSFAVWKEDFDKVKMQITVPNFVFPHTNYLFKLTQKSKYVVCKFKYMETQPLKKKGGYNLPQYFVHEYLTLVENELLMAGHIDQETYNKLERNILKFTADWYCNVKRDVKYTFSFEKDKEIIQNKCGKNGVKRYELYKKVAFCKSYFKGLLKLSYTRKENKDNE